MTSIRVRLEIGLLSILGAAVGGTLFAAAPLFAQTTVGSVIAVSGAATVQRGGGTQPIKAGSPIEEHDRLTTGSRGRVTIAFADHVQILMGESSIAVVERNPNATAAIPRITLISGIVRTITTGADPKTSFEVITPNALVIARAGKADTSFYGASRRRGFPSCDHFTDVAVLDGAAELKNGAGASTDYTTVPSGYVSTIACGSAPTGAGPLGVADARTLSESNSGSGGFLYTFFHDSSPTVEQEDIDGASGVFDRDDVPAALGRPLQPIRGPRAIRLRPHIAHGPIRIAR